MQCIFMRMHRSQRLATLWQRGHLSSRPGIDDDVLGPELAQVVSTLGQPLAGDVTSCRSSRPNWR